MKISLVIPTYNRLVQLKRVLKGLESQSFPCHDFEVLVVSDGATDGTEVYLRELAPPYPLRAFSQANQGPAAARNLGVELAAGDIILFIDDDVVPLPGLIEEHLRSHEQYGDCAVVIGPMLAPPDFKPSPWVRWEMESLAEQYQEIMAAKWPLTARQFYTGNSSVARRHLIAAGGFDPFFRRAEDVELAYRLAERGLKFFFNPRAGGYHYAVRSFHSWLATPYAYGCNDVIFTRQRGQGWLLPAVMREYHQRHALVRALARACLARPIASKAAVQMLKQAALIAENMRLSALATLACSAMFNLRYYEGVADQLGGRGEFFRMARAG